jgi:hypothetical protein
MSIRILHRPVVLLVLALVLVACKRADAPTTSDAGEPSAVVEAGVAALRAGDLRAFVEGQLPPAEIERLRAEHATRSTGPVDDAERERFAAWMAKLTAPDAETRVLAEIEPQLAQFEREIEPQLARNVTMLKGLALVAIQQSETLTPLAKQQAMASLDAVSGWIASTRFTDRARLREAIGHLAAAAREADVATLDELNALGWDESLDRASIAFRAVKRVLAGYGLSLDAVLDSVRVETVSQEGDRARLKVHYVMLGQPISFDVDLVARDGRWYVEDTLAAADRAAAGAAAGG